MEGLGVDVALEKVEDIDTIISFEVLMTPAVVIDGEVKENFEKHPWHSTIPETTSSKKSC